MSENAPIDEHVSRATEQLAPEFAGVGAVWLLTEIVGRTVFSAHGRHRLPRTKRAHPQRRSGR